MNVHYLQHAAFEGLGSIEPWLTRADCGVTSTRLYESGVFPHTGEFDLLIVLGGPMSANDENGHNWLAPEKQFIRAAVAADKGILGICLGAQLIASSLGASVHRNQHKEIGWFPVQGTSTSAASVFAFPHELEVFHWHGETFALPENAARLARSDGCENQAFQLGTKIIGLQFHLETTPESARKIVSNCRDELIVSRYVQSEEEILGAAVTRYMAINTMMDNVLAFLRERL